MQDLRDTRDRPVRDLRISVTDRCNFRCTYCMPKEIFSRDYEFLDRHDLLSFEEIERVARSFARHGVTKIRLTGGEPLLRKGIEELISRLSVIDGIEDLTLTTNGSLLARKAIKLAEAGLDRVTVSLDSMDDEVFMAMNDVGFPVAAVLEGIEAAAEAGLTPIKINMVVKRGVNDDSIVDVADHFRGQATSSASSSSWTSGRRTVGLWTTWCPQPRSSSVSTSAFPSPRPIRTTAGKSPTGGGISTVPVR
jgi:GTP 3',8-cyclase